MDQEPFQDYYAVLGLQLGASHDAIKAAFRALAIVHHPDKSGTSDSTVFRAAREAYEKLTDADYRRAYDRTYWRRKFQTDPPIQQDVDNTRTKQYEAEMRERARRASPPPKKPFKKTGDPPWKYLNSAAYQKWQREMAEYYARHPECDTPAPESEPPSPGPGALAHGLVVNMSHACVLQTCSYRTFSWHVQPGGPDHCVYCVEAHVGCSRCPGCQALACQKCLSKIADLECKPFSSFGNKSQYTASGG